MDNIKEIGPDLFVNVFSPVFSGSEFFTSLLTTRTDLSKCFNSSLNDLQYVTDCGKGKWSPTEEESLKLLRKNIEREIKSLTKKVDDLRPSESRRLEFLKYALAKV